MTARIKLDWDHFDFQAKGIASWKALKQVVDFDDHPELFTDRAVYVIRIRPPFCFKYPKGHSPVAYIGKGQAQTRLTSHLKRWIPSLAARIPELTVRIYYCEPRVRYHGHVCKNVEADLIERFEKRYGELPLQNKRREYHDYDFSYATDELQILHPGKGSHYHWALTPLPRSHFYRG